MIVFNGRIFRLLMEILKTLFLLGLRTLKHTFSISSFELKISKYVNLSRKEKRTIEDEERSYVASKCIEVTNKQDDKKECYKYNSLSRNKEYVNTFYEQPLNKKAVSHIVQVNTGITQFSSKTTTVDINSNKTFKEKIAFFEKFQSGSQSHES